MKKAKDNINYLQEQRTKQDQKKHLQDVVVAETRGLLRQQKIINKASVVKHIVEENYGLLVQDQQICKIFRQQLGLRFKKVHRIAFKGNAEKNLVLRQQFGIRFLELLQSGKRVINVDETWIVDTQFIRSKWQEKGSNHSQAAKKVTPRIAMILAFDNYGEVYFALTQVNTDADVVKMFLSQLSSRLDVERPGWRNDSVVLLDGAQYHTCSDVKEFIQMLKMPVMFTGPYSYAVSPVELFFAYLKNEDINPVMLPTGKK